MPMFRPQTLAARLKRASRKPRFRAATQRERDEVLDLNEVTQNMGIAGEALRSSATDNEPSEPVPSLKTPEEVVRVQQPSLSSITQQMTNISQSVTNVSRLLEQQQSTLLEIINRNTMLEREMRQEQHLNPDVETYINRRNEDEQLITLLEDIAERLEEISMLGGQGGDSSLADLLGGDNSEAVGRRSRRMGRVRRGRAVQRLMGLASNRAVQAGVGVAAAGALGYGMFGGSSADANEAKTPAEEVVQLAKPLLAEQIGALDIEVQRGTGFNSLIAANEILSGKKELTGAKLVKGDATKIQQIIQNVVEQVTPQVTSVKANPKYVQDIVTGLAAGEISKKLTLNLVEQPSVPAQEMQQKGEAKSESVRPLNQTKDTAPKPEQTGAGQQQQQTHSAPNSHGGVVATSKESPTSSSPFEAPQVATPTSSSQPMGSPQVAQTRSDAQPMTVDPVEPTDLGSSGITPISTASNVSPISGSSILSSSEMEQYRDMGLTPMVPGRTYGGSSRPMLPSTASTTRPGTRGVGDVPDPNYWGYNELYGEVLF